MNDKFVIIGSLRVRKDRVVSYCIREQYCGDANIEIMTYDEKPLELTYNTMDDAKEDLKSIDQQMGIVITPKIDVREDINHPQR